MGENKIILNPFHEIVGILSAVRYKNNRLNLYFLIVNKVTVENDDFLYQKFKKLIGNKIAVLNCNGEFKIRRIK